MIAHLVENGNCWSLLFQRDNEATQIDRMKAKKTTERGGSVRANPEDGLRNDCDDLPLVLYTIVERTWPQKLRLGLNLLIRFLLIMLSFITIVLSIKHSMSPKHSRVVRFLGIPFASVSIQFTLVYLLFKFKNSMSPPKQAREIVVCVRRVQSCPLLRDTRMEITETRFPPGIYVANLRHLRPGFKESCKSGPHWSPLPPVAPEGPIDYFGCRLQTSHGLSPGRFL